MDKAPEVFVSDTFIRSEARLAEAWDKWLAHRRGKRWATNNDYIARWNTVFSEWGVEKSIKSLESSLLQGWQGLFEPKGVASTRTLAPKGDTDHAKGF